MRKMYLVRFLYLTAIIFLSCCSGTSIDPMIKKKMMEKGFDGVHIEKENVIITDRNELQNCKEIGLVEFAPVWRHKKTIYYELKNYLEKYNADKILIKEKEENIAFPGILKGLAYACGDNKNISDKKCIHLGEDEVTIPSSVLDVLFEYYLKDAAIKKGGNYIKNVKISKNFISSNFVARMLVLSCE